VEPFLVKSLSEGADGAEVARTYGRLQSFFSFVQTIGSPVVGALLDAVGARACSVVVFAASAASYGVLASATSVRHLFLSKLAAALQHGFLVAQACVASATASGDPAARAAALGRLTTAYTIGATIGPTLGGWFGARGDLYRGARLAVAGSLLSAALSLLLPGAAAAPAGATAGGRASLAKTLEIARRPAVRPLLAVKVVGSVAASMHSTAAPLVLTQRVGLGLDAKALGLSMSASSAAVAALGAFGMAPLVARVGAPGCARLGLAVRGALVLALGGLFAAAIAAGSAGRGLAAAVVGASVCHACAAHVLATSLTTQTTGLARRPVAMTISRDFDGEDQRDVVTVVLRRPREALRAGQPHGT
jgi:OCT family organic cation transporter-like MFS transporter 18